MNIKNMICKHITKTLSNENIKFDFNLSIKKTPQKKWDYQINELIKIAKKIQKNPYYFSKKIVSKIKKNKYDMYEKIDISEKGFINIFLKKTWIEKNLDNILKSSRLGIKPIKPQQTIVIDYSSPNVAKDMHIGHLRSTILGDATARIMEFLGHKIIRTNHIGDWGTNLGIIIAYLIKYKKFQNISQINLNSIYQIAKQEYETNKQFKKIAQHYTIQLQEKNKCCMAIWKKIVDITIKRNEKIYKKLNVSLTNKHIKGESFYNDMLSDIVSDLKEKNIAKEHNGSVIVLLNDKKNRLGNPMGILIQKKDGTFLYATTDLACLKYRYDILHANKILYYIDSRQHQYLTQIIYIAKKSGYISKNLIIEHHNFGMICSENKRPFQTRSGNNIKLSTLLDEAIKRAKIITQKKHAKLSEIDLNYLSERVGIGSIKYFDLSKNRLTNYVFNWKQILAFNGNTGPYIQYGYVRILSIFKTLKIAISKLTGKIKISNLYERQLAIQLLQFEETIIESANKGTPHVICKYLYELTSIFSKFYELCRISSLPNHSNTRNSRLLLAFLTARILKKGLNIIGVSTVKYM